MLDSSNRSQHSGEVFIFVRVFGRLMALDPVCEKPVNPHNAYWMIWYKGTPYYFDNEECQLKFDAKPEHYRLLALERREKQSVY